MSKILKTERVPIMFDEPLLKRLDDYSFENKIRTRAETIRRLVAKGIEREEKQKAHATA